MNKSDVGDAADADGDDDDFVVLIIVSIPTINEIIHTQIEFKHIPPLIEFFTVALNYNDYY